MGMAFSVLWRASERLSPPPERDDNGSVAQMARAPLCLTAHRTSHRHSILNYTRRAKAGAQLASETTGSCCAIISPEPATPSSDDRDNRSGYPSADRL